MACDVIGCNRGGRRGLKSDLTGYIVLCQEHELLYREGASVASMTVRDHPAAQVLAAVVEGSDILALAHAAVARIETQSISLDVLREELARERRTTYDLQRAREEHNNLLKRKQWLALSKRELIERLACAERALDVVDIVRTIYPRSL